jgi:hypothetical protein
MTRGEIVRRATAILGSKSRKDVEQALDRMEGQRIERGIHALAQSKELRKKVSRFKDALIKTRTAFRELPDVLRIPFQTVEPSFFNSSEVKVAHFQTTSFFRSISDSGQEHTPNIEELASVVSAFMAETAKKMKVSSASSPSTVDVLIGVCKRVEQKYRPGKPKRDDGFGQRLAAEEAYALLVRCNKPITTGKNDLFCRLAVILYGNKVATLQRYCRAVVRDKTGSR